MEKIQLSQSQIDFILTSNQTDKVFTPKNKLGLTAQSIYYSSSLSLQELQSVVSYESDKTMPAKLKKIVYGANLLIFSALNPDTQVFEYVHSLYKKYNIDIDKYNRVSSYRKKDLNKKSFYLIENENLMSIAFRLNNKTLIDFLHKNALSNLAITNISDAFQNYYYNDTFKFSADFLQYCIFHLSLNTINDFIDSKNFYQELNRYAHLALSHKNIEQYLDKQPVEDYLNIEKQSTKLTNLYILGLYKEAFQEDFYRTKVFPHVFIKFWEKSTAYMHQTYKINFALKNIDAMFDNFTHFATKKEIQLFEERLYKISENYNKLKKQFDKKDNSTIHQIYQTYKEKGLLKNALNQSNHKTSSFKI